MASRRMSPDSWVTSSAARPESRLCSAAATRTSYVESTVRPCPVGMIFRARRSSAAGMRSTSRQPPACPAGTSAPYGRWPDGRPVPAGSADPGGRRRRAPGSRGCRLGHVRHRRLETGLVSAQHHAQVPAKIAGDLVVVRPAAAAGALVMTTHHNGLHEVAQIICWQYSLLDILSRNGPQHERSAKQPAEARTIGILGAGRVGTAVARQALKAGYRVRIATAQARPRRSPCWWRSSPPARWPSGPPRRRRRTSSSWPSRCTSTARSTPGLLAGRTVIDAMNYWAPIDGEIDDFESDARTQQRDHPGLPGRRSAGEDR